MAANLTSPINRRGTETQRFWRKVKILDDGCWLWIGSRYTDGYGLFYLTGPGSKPKRVLSHVYAFTHCIGPIPAGLELDHLCRNRACVNPLHLEPVTNKVNVLRGSGPTALNARKSHCLNGHPLSGDNLYRTPKGFRACRACRRLFHLLHPRLDHRRKQ